LQTTTAASLAQEIKTTKMIKGCIVAADGQISSFQCYPRSNLAQEIVILRKIHAGEKKIVFLLEIGYKHGKL